MSHPGIYTVVITGGIASGKSAVSDLFARLGAAVVDTDLIAREVVQPGQPALHQIATEFGDDFLDKEGRLDRRKMRATIFSDPEMKHRLEAILHPLIAEEVFNKMKQLNAPYCILVIPLYTESSRYQWVDRVLVIDVPEEIQLERVMVRDRITREQAQAILDAQSSRQTRLAVADDILENSGTVDELHSKVEALHQKYLKLASR